MQSVYGRGVTQYGFWSEKVAPLIKSGDKDSGEAGFGSHMLKKWAHLVSHFDCEPLFQKSKKSTFKIQNIELYFLNCLL